VAHPGDDTALIVPVRLPAPLEALRRRAIPDAGLGLPAHVTLLYPFARREALDGDLHALLAGALAGVDAFAFELRSQARWPEVLFVSVEPDLAFRSLHEGLAAAFPAYPIYGGRFDFVPHVTIAEGSFAARPATADDPAWQVLPARRVARSAELVVRDAERWNVRWRFQFRTGTSTDA
jgi:2'-5' RNA ligase